MSRTYIAKKNLDAANVAKAAPKAKAEREKPNTAGNTPSAQAKIDREKMERTLSHRLLKLRWNVEHLLFTGRSENGKRYFASMSQPRENWPLAIWLRCNARVQLCFAVIPYMKQPGINLRAKPKQSTEINHGR
jgi:hypothetical protein